MGVIILGQWGSYYRVLGTVQTVVDKADSPEFCPAMHCYAVQ